MTKRTSIIVVSWNHKRFLRDCVRALEQAEIPEGSARLIIVDNNSSDGTAEFVREELLKEDGRKTKGGLPVLFLDNKENLGFSGGNNQAMRIAVKDGDEYVYLLNPDTEAQPGFLEEAVRVMEEKEAVGIVQSLLRLHPDTDKINSYGNEIHFLGFGYAGGESVPHDDPHIMSRLRVRDIAYASGAGMLISRELIDTIGYLDEELFVYHEDLEYSWRARMAGYSVILAPESTVFHKYEFSRSIKKYYWMERNRFIVTLRFYRTSTLLLIFPAWIVMEVGLWLFAFRSGWWKEKARAYGYFFRPSSWKKLFAARKRIDRLRVISDREATRLFTGKILFQQMQPTLLTRVANPLFSLYWRIAHFLIIW